VVEIAEDVTPEEMVEIGQGIFQGKGICNTCHVFGRSDRFPDLDGVGARAAGRVPGVTGLLSLALSLYHPVEFIVPGYVGGMPTIDKPPVGLTDDEIKAVIAYLQSLGGEVTVTMDMDLKNGGPGGVQTAEAAAAPPGPENAAEAELAADQPGELSAAGALLANYGCTGCHYTDRPGEIDGSPSLWDVGARMDRDRLLLETVHHEEPLSDGPQGIERIPFGELRTMVDYLAGLQGEGGGGQPG
jgi:cytochrome c2